jgi:UDP-N-acetylmuramoyl-tripeptide--D-alanyl-D-alanine ligase
VISLRLHEVATAVNGHLLGDDVSFYGVSTDTRTLEPNQLFVALRGERFDGHDSVLEAQQKGAAAVLVEQVAPSVLSMVQVDDSRRALGRLAHAWRRRFSIPVIGITGSNGKTSTKEMTVAVLRQRLQVLATRGNLNNDIGVPQTLFGLGDEHTAAVIEMGANRPNDIGDLAKIAEPTVGVVTMCGPAHLEGLGSLEGVASAKGQIYTALPKTGTAVINADDQFAAYWKALAANVTQVSFGIEARADYSAREVRTLGFGQGMEFILCAPGGEVGIKLPFDGRHNVYNALAAAAATGAIGATLEDIQKGLAAAHPVHGRTAAIPGINGALLIDDTYNANPASLAAGLEVLKNTSGQHWLVLGDMAELGNVELTAHRMAGERAKQQGIARLFLIGELAAEAAAGFGDGATHFKDPEQLISALRAELRSGVTLLVKGSRKMQLDKVVAALAATQATVPC